MDRNIRQHTLFFAGVGSLSARRAWIEITLIASITTCVSVALRKESVDRNQGRNAGSACSPYVALRKESVDRNGCSRSAKASPYSRSPQGERG